MSVASLRAYGLPDEILDELAQTRITGLTFAPEAGTQRMRDVVNKNITEAHIEESTRKVFARGWHRVKLYFMIGLPTEEDDDVRGIVETGQRMLAIGKPIIGGRAEVTVSVSSHVPKPHTPLQWCAPLRATRRSRTVPRCLPTSSASSSSRASDVASRRCPSQATRRSMRRSRPCETTFAGASPKDTIGPLAGRVTRVVKPV